MFHPYLKEKYEFITKYFETAVAHPKRDLPHSIILYGSDTLAQYIFALNTAKILNCLNEKKFECDCLNCRWIEANTHPAVMTVSKINNKQAGDDTKNVISIAQAKMVRDAISTTSNYHRVFIFCDAENKKLSEAQKENLRSFEKLGFKLPNADGSENLWYPYPLNTTVFPETTSNALLKSIEEPPENVTFIFLTKNKDDLISTIVSRSQAFCVPGVLKENYNDSFIEELMQDYPSHNTLGALNLSNQLLKYIKEQDMKTSYALCVIQNYLQNLAVENLANKQLFAKIKKDIFSISEAQKSLNVSVKDQNVLENLFIKMF